MKIKNPNFWNYKAILFVVVAGFAIIYLAISLYSEKQANRYDKSISEVLIKQRFSDIATTSKASQEREAKLVIKFDSLQKVHLKYVSDLKAEQYRNKINHTKIDKIKNSELQRFNDSLFKFMNIH
jgi:hypothetical protein